MTPEARLVAAIFAQAVEDIGAGKQSFTAASDGDSAINFLTASFGDTAKWRNELASHIGLDGDAIRQRVVAYLDGKNDIPLTFARASAKTRHARARERWRAMNTRPKPKPAPPKPEPASKPVRAHAPEPAPEPKPIDAAAMSPEELYDFLPTTPFSLADIGVAPWHQQLVWGRIMTWIGNGKLLKVERGRYLKPPVAAESDAA